MHRGRGNRTCMDCNPANAVVYIITFDIDTLLHICTQYQSIAHASTAMCQMTNNVADLDTFIMCCRTCPATPLGNLAYAHTHVMQQVSLDR